VSNSNEPPLDQVDLTSSLARGEIVNTSLDVAKGDVKETAHIPHGKERLFVCGAALAFCLFAGFSAKTPQDTRSTFLSIGSAIITALVRPFDR
jgi:hypothetical protein